MFDRLLSLPLIVILMGFAAIAMYVPAAHAAVLRDFEVMRAFFQSANLLLVLTAMVAIATANRRVRQPGRSYLLALLAAYGGLPVFLAVPFSVSVPDTSFLNAYVEMVSDLTTTGATFFDDPSRLPASVHLWRALVGWGGGLLVLVAAIAILAPMNLGGFEVLSGTGGRVEIRSAEDGSRRLRRAVARLLPIYAAFTLVLWVGLLIAGDRPLVALTHAMSVVSTSGISAIGGVDQAASGIVGEVLIFFMFLLAVTRQFFSPEQAGPLPSRIASDPEFRIAVFLVASVPVLLFLRHWIAALEVQEAAGLGQALKALWGAVFTVLSFLTTTGFQSADWADARQWSGLETPGIILMGLALIGGGVATTAGGVKLLRVYALFKHGAREMDRLVHPSSVGGAGVVARRLRRQGAQVAWVFFMLFALLLALVVVLFTLNGEDFESAVALAIAALSTTGPVLTIAAETPISLHSLSAFSKLILAGAMVLGRLELLAIIALMNPDFWRR